MDEATTLARETLSLMRRNWWGNVAEWVYFFWRRGQVDPAVRLLGASDAWCIRTGSTLQANEQRLIHAARADLQASLDENAFESCLAAGAALDERGLLALISDALAVAGCGR
jgi:hypothetical protein